MIKVEDLYGTEIASTEIHMTKFTKETLIDSNGWLSYAPHGWSTPHAERKFIANFCKRRSGKDTFITFLIKNFTVEEYFAMLDAGMAPLDIAKTKGYLLPHIKKWLKERGLPQTQDGFRIMIQQDIALRAA
jgi:hypothetical protein